MAHAIMACTCMRAQGKYKELWLQSVRHVFEEMDTDGDGRLDREELMGHLGEHLQPQEVHIAHICSVLLEGPSCPAGACMHGHAR
jgi:hypothetical protein